MAVCNREQHLPDSRDIVLVAGCAMNIVVLLIVLRCSSVEAVFTWVALSGRSWWTHPARAGRHALDGQTGQPGVATREFHGVPLGTGRISRVASHH